MAKISIIICDYCKEKQKTDLYHSIMLDDENPFEVCEKCFYSILEQFQSDTKLVSSNNSSEELRVPSNLDNLKTQKVKTQKPKCSHDKKDFDESGITCSDCKEKLGGF